MSLIDGTRLTPEELRKTASRIRDDLDPIIAREGPHVMQPNDVLVLHELFQSLLIFEIPLSSILYSRMHHAVSEVAGKATRWPAKLADICDDITILWTRQYGRLADLKAPLYGPGGRLHGVCTMDDLTREACIGETVEAKMLMCVPVIVETLGERRPARYPRQSRIPSRRPGVRAGTMVDQWHVRISRRDH